jgi:hypothetical protein
VRGLFEKPGLVAGGRNDQMKTNLRMFANLLDPLIAASGPSTSRCCGHEGVRRYVATGADPGS